MNKPIATADTIGALKVAAHAACELLNHLWLEIDTAALWQYHDVTRPGDPMNKNRTKNITADDIMRGPANHLGVSTSSSPLDEAITGAAGIAKS